jgi:hypothetical protein
MDLERVIQDLEFLPKTRQARSDEKWEECPEDSPVHILCIGTPELDLMTAVISSGYLRPRTPLLPGDD